MNQKYFYSTALLVMMLVSPLFPVVEEDVQTKKLTQGRITFFPVPSDNINYVFLQSIENDTAIVIGDFSGVEKKIIMIVDNNNDNTIDSVIEYYPLTKDLKKRKDSNSKFFTKDIAKLKKDIIEGSVYKGNYTDRMESFKTLEKILRNSDTNSLNADVYGFNIKSYETDERKKYSALFSYGKSAGGYYLQFKTEYYRKDYKTVQKPVLKYSVYCKDTTDPVVKETVEYLFTIRQPMSSNAKGGTIQKSN